MAVVDNAEVGEREVVSHGRHWLSGDNGWREFSGWDKGVRYWRSVTSVAADDTFVLVNDTFHRSYGTDYLEGFEPSAVEAALATGHVVGYVDAYPRPVELFGLSMQAWVRTSCFAVRGGDLEKIGPLALNVDEGVLFADDCAQFFAEEAPLSANYRAYLATWLWGKPARDDGFDEAWHSQVGLSPATFEALKGKAKAILSEHYLSARARQCGLRIHPTCPLPPGLPL